MTLQHEEKGCTCTYEVNQNNEMLLELIQEDKRDRSYQNKSGSNKKRNGNRELTTQKTEGQED